MNIDILKNIKNDKILRESFFELAIKTFDLSFEKWFTDDYWTDNYIPYSIAKNGKVIANASVNIIDTMWHNKPKRYIQIGTAMTDIPYRGKGLSRLLMGEILNDWQENSDAIYLYANNSVLNFYPLFGFIKEHEYQYSVPIKVNNSTNSSDIIKLNMSNNDNKQLLEKYYKKSNPFSMMPMINNYGLLMFHCSATLKDCVFYSKNLDAVIIAEYDNYNLICHDIYCDAGKSLDDILSALSTNRTKTATLGFTPKDMLNHTSNIIDNEDETLFVFKNNDNIFKENKVRMPTLSHA